MHPGPMNRGIEIQQRHRRRPAERHPEAGDERPGGADGGAVPGDAGWSDVDGENADREGAKIAKEDAKERGSGGVR